MRCPVCDLDNPSMAQRCDCGYDFHSQKMEASYLTSKQRQFGTFYRIAGKDDALKIIKETSIAFLVVAAIQGALGLFVSHAVFFDAAAYSILALALFIWKSRLAALLLSIISALSVLTTFLNKLGLASQGGTNIVLALIIFCVSARAVEATFKLHGQYTT